MKVPILLLALLAAVAGNMTALTTFKVLSFLSGCLQLEKTLYKLATQDQKLGLVLDFPKTLGPCYYHKQDRYSPVPLHTQNYLNPAGPLLAKQNLDFQLTSFPGTHVSLPRMGQRRRRPILPTMFTYCFLCSSTSGDPAVVFGFVGSFGAKFATDSQ